MGMFKMVTPLCWVLNNHFWSTIFLTHETRKWVVERPIAKMNVPEVPCQARAIPVLVEAD
jgi:hypothetical protein